MSKIDSKLIKDFREFLDNSPTSWHACRGIKQQLSKAGFIELREDQKWEISLGKNYFVCRNEASCIAFRLPKKQPQECRVLYSHTDSPALKVKPEGFYEKEGLMLVGLEIYGAPILSSWIGRDLTLAGRLFYEQNQEIKSQIVYYPAPLLFIPHLAIHLDRQVNESGHIVHKQDHLSAILAISTLLLKGKSVLEALFAKQLPKGAGILHHELFAVPFEKSQQLGYGESFLTSYRLDNLGGTHACLKGILENGYAMKSTMNIAVFSHHEEVGSETYEGAASPFFSETLQRICCLLKLDEEKRLQLKARSFGISVDLTHAYHPNFPDKLDPRHQVHFEQGVVFKTSSQEKYTSQADIVAKLVRICEHTKISYSIFAGRNDIPSGSTVGPIHACHLGIKTIDVGYPQLAMHACREMIAIKDHQIMVEFLKRVLRD